MVDEYVGGSKEVLLLLGFLGGNLVDGLVYDFISATVWKMKLSQNLVIMLPNECFDKIQTSSVKALSSSNSMRRTGCL